MWKRILPTATVACIIYNMYSCQSTNSPSLPPANNSLIPQASSAFTLLFTFTMIHRSRRTVPLFHFREILWAETKDEELRQGSLGTRQHKTRLHQRNQFWFEVSVDDSLHCSVPRYEEMLPGCCKNLVAFWFMRRHSLSTIISRGLYREKRNKKLLPV